MTPAAEVKVSESQMKALGVLVGAGCDWCLPFAAIQDRSGLPQHMVRRTVRALARKGLAQYQKGLWSEDGGPAGAGYCVTKAGLEFFSVNHRVPV